MQRPRLELFQRSPPCLEEMLRRGGPPGNPASSPDPMRRMHQGARVVRRGAAGTRRRRLRPWSDPSSFSRMFLDVVARGQDRDAQASADLRADRPAASMPRTSTSRAVSRRAARVGRLTHRNQHRTRRGRRGGSAARSAGSEGFRMWARTSDLAMEHARCRTLTSIGSTPTVLGPQAEPEAADRLSRTAIAVTGSAPSNTGFRRRRSPRARPRSPRRRCHPR